VAGHFAPRGDDDVLAGAEVTIQGRFVNQRLAPVPMEPEAILVVPEAGRLTVWATSQTPFALRAELASSLGMAESEIRVVVGDMGGGFGAKAGARPYTGDMRVLLVEDDSVVRGFIRMQLEKLGYRVVSAASGSEALELLEREGGIDLLFTDLRARARARLRGTC